MAPLALVTDLQASPFWDLARDFTASTQTALVTRASRSIESMCGRRLAPFTNIVETSRAQAVDPDESISYAYALDQTAALGMSRAASLGSSDLVRHAWVRNRPPLYQDLWTGSLTTINAYLTVASVVSVPLTNAQFETDTGHIRLSLGSFVPAGSTLQITYSGGYTVAVPDDLVLATLLQTAIHALLMLDPEAKPSMDIAEMRGEIAQLISPYIADGDD